MPKLSVKRAPKGRNKPAQGSALGKAIPEDQSPEGARQSCVINLPDLPNSWHYAQVQDVGATDEQAVMTGPFGTNLGRGDFISKGVPLLTISCLTDQGIRMDKALYVSEAKANELGRYRLKQGDLLFSRMASVGRAGIVGPQQEGALFNYHIMRLRLDDAKMLPKFFTSYVRGAKQVYDYLLEVNHGATRDGINTEQLLSMPIILAPISDQRRIVAEIEKQFTRLEAGVAALRRVQANLKRYRAAVLKAACEGRLVPTENWAIKAMSDVTSVVTKGSSPNWQGFDYCDAGVVFVRSQNVGWGKLDLSDVAHLPVCFNEKEKKSVLKTGDVLLNIVGASIGRAAIATSEVAGGNVNQAVAVIRCQQERILPQFLMVYLLSPATQTLIHSQAVDVARANFSLGDISRMTVPIPPLAEQTRIVAEVERRLSVVEELEAVVSTNLQRATRLRQSILQKAFTGEL